MLSRLTLLSLAALFFSITIFILVPILPVYLYQDLGASEQEVGLIIPLAFLTSAFLRIPSSLKIRRGILKVLVLGLTLNALAVMGYGISWNPISFAFFRILHGFSLAINYTLLLTVAGMVVEPSEVEKGITSYTTMLALGFWIGPLAGIILRGVIELRYIMFAASLIGAAAIMFSILLSKNWNIPTDEINEEESLSLKSVLKLPNIFLALVYLTFSLAMGAIFAYGPLKAKLEFGLTDQLVILFFLIYYFSAFLARLLLLKSKLLIERLGLIKLIIIGLLESSFGILITGLSRNLMLFGLGLCLAGLAHGLIFPLTASAVALATPIQLRNLGNSLHLTAFDIGSLLGSVTGSILVGFMPISYSLAALCVAPLLGLIPLKAFSHLKADQSSQKE